MFFLPFFVPALAETCTTYQCGTASSTSGVCSAYSTATGIPVYTMTPCSPGLICAPAPASSTTCAYPAPNSRYPGAYCASPLDCISGVCTLSTCVGTPLDGPCTDHSQCAPGTYCLTPSADTQGTCAEQLLYGEACAEDAECLNDSICDGLTCVKMFSLDTGNTTSIIWAIGLAPACSSGYAFGTEAPYECAVAPTSVDLGSDPTLCPESGECTSGGTATKQCVCNFDLNQYCPLFEGDLQVVSMIRQWQAMFPLSLGKCSTVDRWSYACFAAQDSNTLTQYVNFAVAASLYLNNTWIHQQEDPYCLQGTVMLDYYNLKYQQTTSGTCPVFICTKSLPGNQCVFYNRNIYNSFLQTVNMVQVCPSGYTCPTNGGDTTANATCEPPGPPDLNPGEYCITDLQCMSELCIDNRCSGQDNGDTCSSALLCNVGYYCTSENVCAPVLDNGSKCETDDQCLTLSYCPFGKCVAYFSQTNWTPTVMSWRPGHVMRLRLREACAGEQYQLLLGVRTWSYLCRNSHLHTWRRDLLGLHR